MAASAATPVTVRSHGLRQFRKGGTPSRRRMPRAELLWPVHCLAYVQRGRTAKDGAGEPSTDVNVVN